MCLHHEWCDDVCHVQEAQQLVPVLPLKCFRRVYLWLYLSTTFTQTQPPASTQLRSNGLSIITLWLPRLVKAFCDHFFWSSALHKFKAWRISRRKRKTVWCIWIQRHIDDDSWLSWTRVWTHTWKEAGSSVGSSNQSMITFKTLIRSVILTVFCTKVAFWWDSYCVKQVIPIQTDSNILVMTNKIWFVVARGT